VDKNGAGQAVVLGAAGFIGRHVCRHLADQGMTVLGLGHGTWDAAEQRRWGISRWLEADIGPDALRLLVRGAEVRAVIHCGGSSAVSRSYSAPREDFQRSVDSTADVLEFARSCAGGAPRVVVASSAAVYGDQGDVDLLETSTRSPISPYGFHKLLAEQLCDSYARFFAVPVSIVRLFSVYGEGLRKQLLWDAANKFDRGDSRFFGTGQELRDWVHVDDAARLLCTAACAPQANFEVYNGGHHKATTHEVLSRLARALGRGIEPGFNGQIHTGNPRRLTSDSGRAMRQLGWSPRITLEEGLSRYVAWFNDASLDRPAA
jgi:UDP-glucose 4-epimerase